ncbi:leguminosin group486 secreted peptide [Medicago truncatula]|uniref:Leguminosin group486 secreted peptide n=1 Tax=Medicago truncatula TaxID=3880 RepID=A0A072UDU8_MEDTR|nr:leguminosin group486 secreted peptide [Medicago truncatula]
MSISIHKSFSLLLVIVMSFNNSTFEELHFIIVNEKPNYVLKQGVPLNFLTNFLPKQGQLTWIRKQPLHATFNLYDPNTEGDHKKIFWSVRQDGVYHSWDNVNWNKNTKWST